MADVTLAEMLTNNPVTADLTGDEPIETVVAATSEAAKLRQLSFAPLNAQTGTAYTLAASDQGKVVTMSNAAANVVTVPLDATTTYAIGTTLLVRQIGTGVTSFVAEGGVTIQNKASITLSISEKFGQAVLHKIASETWHICGELALL